MKLLVGGFQGIVLHHSLTKDGKVVDWEAIKKYHIQEQGWDDIGYHAGIERINGIITPLAGRDWRYEGGHTKGNNDCFGFCIVGNFDVAPPDAELMERVVDSTLAFMKLFKIAPDKVRPHNMFAPKSCPGTQFPWDSFMNRINYIYQRM